MPDSARRDKARRWMDIADPIWIDVVWMLYVEKRQK